MLQVYMFLRTHRHHIHPEILNSYPSDVLRAEGFSSGPILFNILYTTDPTEQ